MTRKQKYQKATEKIQEAINLIREISKENQKDWDADRYLYELSEILECDNGEAGLIPFINSIQD